MQSSPAPAMSPGGNRLRKPLSPPEYLHKLGTMAIIVENKETKERFLLAGSGYGLAQSTRPGLFFGNLLPEEMEAQAPMVCLADADGDLAWVVCDQVRIVEVDGEPLDSLAGLASFPKNEVTGEVEVMHCERCGKVIRTPVCPHCS